MSSNLLVVTTRRVQGSIQFDDQDIETACGLIEACWFLVESLDAGPEDADT